MTASQQDCDCNAAKEQLDAFRRGELSLEQIQALGQHIEHCRDCHCLQQYEAAFLECLQRVGRSGCCPDQLRARVGELLATPERDA